ncbi:MAG: UbiH/UbiF/VisC/COQ6 family ubiquinone biosynthesis hydroxylase [Thermaurantiacus sp.]
MASGGSIDTIIVGGGLVGQTLALALEAHGLRVAIIERADPDSHLAANFDGRASAIASSSARMLTVLGLGGLLEEEGCSIRAIRVTEGLRPGGVHFEPAEAGDDSPLGIMVENRLIRRVLLERVRASQAIDFHAPARITSVERGRAGVRVQLEDGAALTAPVLVAADGRRSRMREEAGIRVARWQYPASGIVTMMAHEKPHGSVASEIFYPTGPFAILPMTDLADGRHRSALVWTVPAKDASGIVKLPPRALAAEARQRMGNMLGKIELIAPAEAWPLGFHHAERYRAERTILVGDAAHGIHPIAGQGLNLGWRDVAALAQVLAESARLGLDLGDPQVGARYERWRRLDNAMVAAATDWLARLFAVPGRPAAAVRHLGLRIVEHTPPLKRLFMSEARGESGDLPALLRGELA